MADARFDDLTPEEALWAAALETYLQDVRELSAIIKARGKRHFSEWRARKELAELPDLIRSRDTRWICSLIGLNHQKFVQRVEIEIQRHERERRKRTRKVSSDHQEAANA